MADKKISELDAVDPLAGDELIPVVQSGENKSVTVGDLSVVAVQGILAIFADKEVPTGAIDDANQVFVLASDAVAGSEHVFVDGVLKLSPTDYSIVDDTITFVAPPSAGSVIVVSYRKA